MNDQELIPEQQLTALLELDAASVDESLDLWKLIEKQVTASAAANIPAPDDFQNIEIFHDSLDSSRRILTFPRVLKYALGLAAVLAIAFIVGTALQPGKSDSNKDPYAVAGPSKPPNTIPGTSAIVPAATPSVRMLSASLKATLTGASADVRAVGWKADGTQVAAGSDNGTINTWDISGKLLDVIPMPGTVSKLPWPYKVSWSNDGNGIGIGSNNGDFPGPNGSRNATRVNTTTLQITNASGDVLSTITIPGGAIEQVAWSPNGKYIAASGFSSVPAGMQDIRVWIWKADGTLAATILNYHFPINDLAWSPDGNNLAIAAKGENEAGVWNFEGTQIADFKGNFVVWDLAWSPDGNNLAAACSDNTVRIYWNMMWGADEYKLSLTGHQDTVWAVAWSPDGRTLASGSADKTVKLWTIK